MLQEDTGGHRRPQEATGSHQRPQKATGAHRRPQEATECHRRPQEATGGHMRPLEATGGHRRPQEARAFVCVCVLVGYSRKVMGENSEVFVPSKNHRSRLPLYRVTWVEPLATPTSRYSHFVFLTCSLCSGVSDAALSCKVAG
jgi:hypothetical protein